MNESDPNALEAREVKAVTLKWNGIPVLVTGAVETHPSNWALIGTPGEPYKREGV